MVNLNEAEWFANPANYTQGIRLFRIHNQYIPIDRPACPFCTDMKVLDQINTLSDDDLFAAVQKGQLHGLKRPIALYNNHPYHKPCLIQLLGQDQFDSFCRMGEIISE